MKLFHETVLLKETIDALGIKTDGIYIDGTAGGGGFSYEIARGIGPNGRLIAIDCDPDAARVCRERFKSFGNVKVFMTNFTEMAEICRGEFDTSSGIIDGIILDLGLSSYQIDVVERGFSYVRDAPLDMRMSRSGVSAFDVVNVLGEHELTGIFFKFGEERFAREIAKKICILRRHKKIETTLELVKIIKSCVPFSKNGHPAKRVFQALRIFINNELYALQKVLELSIELLRPGGKLAVLTFHSLEDRIVKRNFVLWQKGCICPKQFPICTCGKKPLATIEPKKPILPSAAEISENPRSKRAKLRICKKL